MARIFVTGPGRCGTVTFATACAAASLSDGDSPMTVAHESLRGQEPDWTYPDNHIETEPRLLWQVHDLLRAYPEALWVVLHRDHEDMVQSWAKRVYTMAAWSRLSLFTGTISPDTIGLYLDFVYSTLDALLPPTRTLNLTTPVPGEEFKKFVEWAGLKAKRVEAGVATLKLKHNPSK